MTRRHSLPLRSEAATDSRPGQVGGYRTRVHLTTESAKHPAFVSLAISRELTRN
jgi:hypothetical protein